MGADLISVKQEFTNLILNIQPWTLSHFMMWLDLKVAEYKIHGYLAIEQESTNSKDHGLLSDGNSRPLPSGKQTIIIPQQAIGKICHCHQGDNKTVGLKTHELHPPMNFDASRTKRYSYQNSSYMQLPVSIAASHPPSSLDSSTEKSDHFQNFLYRAFMKNPALNSHSGASSENPTPEYDSNDEPAQSSAKRFKTNSPCKNVASDGNDRNTDNTESVQVHDNPRQLSSEVTADENDNESEEMQETVTSSENKSPENENETDSTAKEPITQQDNSMSQHSNSTSEQISRIIIKEEILDDQEEFGGVTSDAEKADTPEPAAISANSSYRDFLTFDMCSLSSQRSANNRRTPERMSTDTLVSYLDLDDQMADRPRHRRNPCTVYNISSTSENPILSSNTDNLSGIFRPLRKSGCGTTPSSPGPVQERLSCDQCGHHFSTRSSLNRHKATHGEKKHRCFVCSKAFHRKEHLCLHLERHLQSTDITCPTCNEKGHSVKWLEEHYRKWHQGSP